MPYRVRWQDLKDLFRSNLPSPSETSSRSSPPPQSQSASSSSPLSAFSSSQPQQPPTTTNPILRADVSLGPDNRSRGFGTVLMSNKEDAYRAVEKLNGYCWQGRVLEVRIDRVIGTTGSSASSLPPGTGISGPSMGYEGTSRQGESYGNPGIQGTAFVSPENIRNLGKSLIVANVSHPCIKPCQKPCRYLAEEIEN